ncbi:MAG TPA: hypothetical protein VKA44_06135, partial [Gemmatimonadota bacterium]|nr:hypothetical protein [Gemmatimonadota bacterium]
TPYVGWADGDARVRENVELAGHVWVPVRALVAPEHRATLRLERRGAVRVFPAVEYGGRTIWGLTFRIVREFLDIVGAATGPDVAPSSGYGASRG